MPQLTAEAMRPVDQHAVADDTAADARAQRDIDQVLRLFADAEVVLPESRCVSVVTQLDAAPGELGQPFP